MNDRMMTDSICVAGKFRGPPHSGNGGYVAGVIADALMRSQQVNNALADGPIEVTLRAPTPLDRALPVIYSSDVGTLRVVDDDTLIAEAKVVSLELAVPIPVSWQEAMQAREYSYSLPMGEHPFFEGIRRGAHPVCFCCGAEPPVTESLHVYSAAVKNNEQVAAAWIPHACFADETGYIRPEFLWTALDCPGQMAWRARDVRTGMLGRLTAHIDKRVRASERCVVIGWTIANEGKKYLAGTALVNEANELCAYAKTVWIGRFD
jgi:hypothetical protein